MLCESPVTDSMIDIFKGSVLVCLLSLWRKWFKTTHTKESLKPMQTPFSFSRTLPLSLNPFTMPASPFTQLVSPFKNIIFVFQEMRELTLLATFSGWF